MAVGLAARVLAFQKHWQEVINCDHIRFRMGDSPPVGEMGPIALAKSRIGTKAPQLASLYPGIVVNAQKWTQHAG
jgi:hypothetical protein